ncbi:hypothetical protein CIW49_13540 [Mycolicibacterium sp. P1-18]|uniref:hypothetical protein n=1 Tax=Mycolicibacterium sp. P1-18 TaxID=2024615 RepID=UPI0011F38864|nr:hypothetical protein [Mycolicibacterium sp. P1-18]KAA0098895.1 hypothetical protein CIW49_13540 [Mycolicibacterium sp. P1-18]
MKIVFLHGIGDGEPDYSWLDGLNRGMEQAGYPAIEREQVIAPRYSALLKTDEHNGAKLPPVTYHPKDEGVSRREFERRQARVQRYLRLNDGVRSYGFNLLPELLWSTVPQFVYNNLALWDLDQVRRYVREEKVRAAVMNHILDHMPAHGDVILVGHSLGSVIAIDLLDHLATDLHVRRFITIGSPATIRALHEGSERLLKRFPYGRVDDWSNFLSVRDIVTGGRGLARTFPGAQDFVLNNVSAHDADLYLGDPAVAALVAHSLYLTKEVVPAGSGIAVRMGDPEASALLLHHFARAVGRNIKDADRAARFRAALRIMRDDLSEQVAQYAAAGKLLSPELVELMNGKLPELPHRWELHEAVGELVVLALTNCIAPYEIDPGEAQMLALNDIAVDLGFQRGTGTKVADAIKEVNASVVGRSGVPWGQVLTAAAGLAILAAGPVGLAVAAPAGAFGAAALTGGLAAFGPGGMIGGLAMLGGLTGAGAATTAAALAGGGGSEGGVPNLQKIMIRVSTEFARKKLDLPFDTTLWYQMTDFEGQISAVLNRLKAFDDPKSGKIVQLTAAQVAISALLRFMMEKGLSPEELTDGEQKSLEK